MTAAVRPEAGRGKAERAELDDLTLARARRGEEVACRALVERYEGRVFALLSRMLTGAGCDRVEDLAQETFLRVFRSLPDFRPGGAARPSTWILTIATRLAIDELRRRARRPPEDAAPAEVLASPERADEGAERAALRRRIADAVEHLTAEQRAVFLLRAAHELTYEEIAEAVDCDVGTVRSRLSRARSKLRDALAATGESHG